MIAASHKKINRILFIAITILHRITPLTTYNIMSRSFVNGFRLWDNIFQEENYGGTLDRNTLRRLHEITDTSPKWQWRYYAFDKCAVALVESSDILTLKDQIEFIENVATENKLVDMYLTNWIDWDVHSNMFQIPPNEFEIYKVVREQQKRRRLSNPAIIRKFTRKGPLTIAPRPWVGKDVDEYCLGGVDFDRREELFKKSFQQDALQLGPRFCVGFEHPERGDDFEYRNENPFPPPSKVYFDYVYRDDWEGKNVYEAYHWRMGIKVSVNCEDDPICKSAISFYRHLMTNVTLGRPRLWGWQPHPSHKTNIGYRFLLNYTLF